MTHFAKSFSIVTREHHQVVDITREVKGALVGPSPTIPVIDGKLALGTWQNVFFCEFDGPRRERRIIVSITS